MPKLVIACLALAALLGASSGARAQTGQELQAPRPQAPPAQPPAGYGQPQPAPVPPPPPPPAGAYGQTTPTFNQGAPAYQQPAPYQPPAPPTRDGFTLELTIGVGHQIMQADSGSSTSATLLSGLNLGIGAFVTPDWGVLFRISGTNVEYDGGFGTVNVISAVAGVVAQFWPTDFVKLEAGPGIAVLSGSLGGTSLGDERGFGFIVSGAGQLFEGGGHSLQLGIEYAPAFFSGGTVHNLGFTFGWQLL